MARRVPPCPFIAELNLNVRANSSVFPTPRLSSIRLLFNLFPDKYTRQKDSPLPCPNRLRINGLHPPFSTSSATLSNLRPTLRPHFLTMVGWLPPILEDRIERLGEFSSRVKEAHNFAPNETAFILHYDSGTGDLRPYLWYASFPSFLTLVSRSF
jgi:hypothetical protein